MVKKSNLKLTERDTEFLNILGKFGAIYISDVREKIYTSERYYRNRLKKLEENYYVIRYGKRIVYLGKNGVEFLKENDVTPRTVNSKIEYKKKLAEIFKIANTLNNFKVETSSEVREKNYNVLATKRYRFYLRIITSNSEEYWIYKIGKVKNISNREVAIKSKQLDISIIKRDIEERINESDREDINAIILCDDEHSLALYKNDSTKLGLKKEIAILYNDENLNYINDIIGASLNANGTIKLLLERDGYSVIDITNRSSVDFILSKNDKEYHTFNLTDMNLNKEKALRASIDIVGNPERFALICYKEKEEYYKVKFTDVNIIVLDRPMGIVTW